MKKLIKELEQLNNDEIESIIFRLLKNNKINYTKLSTIYVNYLKTINAEKYVIIEGLCIPLSEYWQKDKRRTKQGIFIRCKGAYNMLKSNFFRTSKFEKILQKYVDKYEYSEDDNGFHKLNLEKKLKSK